MPLLSLSCACSVQLLLSLFMSVLLFCYLLMVAAMALSPGKKAPPKSCQEQHDMDHGVLIRYLSRFVKVSLK